MANVSLIPSSDITITQTGSEIELKLISSSLLDRNEYSTTQEIPIGKWIDGKTIYRKTFSFGQIDGSSYTIQNAFSNVAEFISISGSYKTGQYDRVPISVYYSDTYNCATTLNINTNTIGIGWSGWPKLMGGNITLEYTKTTD